MSERWLFPLLATLPFVLMLFFMDLSINNSPVNDSLSEPEQAPASIIEKTSIRQFNHEGKLTQKVESRSLTSNVAGNLLNIDAPMVTFTDSQNSHWQLNSKTGIYDRDKEHFIFSENVRLERAKDQQQFILNTEKLDYFPNLRVAETNQPVIISTKGHRLESGGMKIDFSKSMFHFYSGVRSQHAPLQ